LGKKSKFRLYKTYYPCICIVCIVYWGKENDSERIGVFKDEMPSLENGRSSVKVVLVATCCRSEIAVLSEATVFESSGLSDVVLAELEALLQALLGCAISVDTFRLTLSPSVSS
jgi:hypothetical protein